MQKNTFKQIMFAVGTFALYTIILNWKMAVMLTVGVGFHEYSHLWAAKQMKMNTKGFYLLPFIGGVALIEGRYRTYAQQAFVVLAGPMGGGLLALVTAGMFHLTGVPELAAVAAWMCFLNIFNLFPLSFMDGGQLLTVVTYSLNRRVGVALYTLSTVLATIFLWKFNFILSIMIGFLGGMSVANEIRNLINYENDDLWKCDENWIRPPISMNKKQIALTIFGWLGTAAILWFAMMYLRKLPESDMSLLLPSLAK